MNEHDGADEAIEADDLGLEHGSDDEGTPDFEDFLRDEKGDDYLTPDEHDQMLADEAAGLTDEESEQDPDAEDTDEESVEAKSDEEQPAEEPKAEPKKTVAEERLVKRLQRSEARVVELERMLRETQTKAPKADFSPSGDLIGDVIQLAARYVGADVQDSDPRVQEQLRQIGVGIVAELAGDQADPELRGIREQRAAARRHAEVQRQIDELKRQNSEKEVALREAEARNFVASSLKEIGAEEEYPFLFAAADDVAAAVYAGLDALHAQGYQINSREAAIDAMAYVCKTLEDEHRRVAERLERAKNGKNSPATPNHPSTETRGAQKDGPSGRNRGEDRGRGKTVTASGKGTRQAPAPKAERSMTQDEIFEETLREQREEARRAAAAAQRTRR